MAKEPAPEREPITLIGALCFVLVLAVGIYAMFVVPAHFGLHR